jgi:broad specificity phosphatase PhoE
LADTHFTAIHTSDLKRAFTTAQALYEGQKDPKPTFDSSEILREQNYGVAEGKSSWSPRLGHYSTIEEEVALDNYPNLRGPDEKFPGGESLNDLVERAKKAITQLVLPYIWKAAKEGSTDTHVAIVSHGHCLGAMISELLKMGGRHATAKHYSGLFNTAWTRVVINIEVRTVG